MKLKTALILIIIACVLGAAHYNEQLTISITLPSPAQVADAAGKVINELKESTDPDYISIETHDNNQYSELISSENCANESPDIYRVRASWDNVKSQIGAYSKVENAISNCPVGYHVFNPAGEIIFTPSLG
jgi:hypothetical protein